MRSKSNPSISHFDIDVSLMISRLKKKVIFALHKTSFCSQTGVTKIPFYSCSLRGDAHFNQSIHHTWRRKTSPTLHITGEAPCQPCTENHLQLVTRFGLNWFRLVIEFRLDSDLFQYLGTNTCLTQSLSTFCRFVSRFWGFANGHPFMQQPQFETPSRTKPTLRPTEPRTSNQARVEG